MAVVKLFHLVCMAIMHTKISLTLVKNMLYNRSVLSYFIITENTLCQLASCFACIYVDTLIPRLKLNCTHMHFQVHYYCVRVFLSC